MTIAVDTIGNPSGARLPMDDYLVDGWLVQPSLNRVARQETSIRVRPQLIDVLTCLAQRRGAVVSKDELLATVWSDRFVAESGIARCVAELRQLLADDARQPRIIETIPKRGYRLIAPVRAAAAPDPTRPHEPARSPAHDDDSGRRLAGPAADPASPAMSGARATVLLAAVAGRFRRIIG